MPTPNEKLAESLAELEKLKPEAGVFLDLRTCRGFTASVSSAPASYGKSSGLAHIFQPRNCDGDSTPWFASFWEFCARYCEERFLRDWHLSPEQSLLISAENTVIPRK